MSIFDVLTLIGGLAMFLFGMNVMGQALEKAAGNRLKVILSRMTDNPLKGLLLGLGVTAVIQSSSATTVMVVGFVNSGIMELQQAIGVIMGANIGTTVTSWILSLTGIDSGNIFVQLLKPANFTPILAIIGLVIYVSKKTESKKDLGLVMLGFAVLMYGMEAMSGAVSGLKGDPNFTNILLMFSNPILGVLAGMALTAIIQSSSASVGILQALSATGAISYGAAIPIIMGQNIGTTVTALISSVGTTTNARRAAAVHLYFNLIGTVFCLAVFYGVNAIVDFAFVNTAIDQLGIAVVHTIFNLSCTLVLLPFTKLLEKLAVKTVNDKEVREQKLLDERLLSTPSIALERSRRVVGDMAKIVRESLLLAVASLVDYDKANFARVQKLEKLVDKYEDELGSYLVKLSAKPLAAGASRTISKILHCINDFERISDHALNIAECAKEMSEKDLHFSQEATHDMIIITDAMIEIINLSIDAFLSESEETARLVEPLENVIDDITVFMKNEHVRRLQEGNCTIELGFIYNDLLTNYERVGDHCSNIAVCQLEMNENRFDSHAYIDKVKTGENPQYVAAYKAFQEKYSLN